MSQALILVWAGTVVAAFVGGFGSCLMLLRRINQDAPE